MCADTQCTVPSCRYEFRPCNAVLPEWPRADWDVQAVQEQTDSVSKEDLCCFWMTPVQIAAGEEVCLNYGYLTTDLVSIWSSVMLLAHMVYDP